MSGLPFLGLLEGISPWWWVALAIALGAFEMVTVTTYLIWSALAAFLTALFLWLVPGLSGGGQLTFFALWTIIFLAIGRTLVLRSDARGDGAGKLNRRGEQLVGREALVESFDFHEGRVVIDGVPWPARLEGSKTPEIGERVRVIAADGIVVWVKRIPGAAAEIADG